MLERLVLEEVFDGAERDFLVYQAAQPDAARLIWETKTERKKLSLFAEEFFRRLAAQLSLPMLCSKGELHRLVAKVSPDLILPEVRAKLDLLEELFRSAVSSPPQTTG